MASLTHAQKLTETTQSLGSSEISECARAEILLFMTTLVAENARLKADLRGSMMVHRQEIANLHHQIASEKCASQAESARTARKLQEQVTSLQKKLADSEHYAESLSQENDRLKTDKVFLSGQIAEKDEWILTETNMRSNQDDLRQKNESLEHDLSALHSARHRQDKEIARLHELISSHRLPLFPEDSVKCEACGAVRMKPFEDDCSPIPRIRQEAAEWARNTDPDGKPLRYSPPSSPES